MKIIDRLTTGDVIYTSCVGLPFCYHLGIVYDNGKNKVIYHNAPHNINKFGGSIVAEKYEDFILERQIIKIVRTGATKENIINASNKCREDVWDTFHFNCEEFVLEVVEGHRRSDLRDAWKICALGIIIIAFM
jgi:hypothetical protein